MIEADGPVSRPGAVLRALRTERGLTVRGLAKAVGIPYSTLSKLETGKMALTYDKMVSLAQGLQVDLSQLLTPSQEPPPPTAASGRRSVARAEDWNSSPSKRFSHNYLAQDLLSKKMSPVIIEVTARSIDELGGMVRHSGEEFVFVVSGVMELHSEFYAPLALSAGDSVYFDSGMAHGYVCVGNDACRVLSVCAGEGMRQLATAISRDHDPADT